MPATASKAPLSDSAYQTRPKQGAVATQNVILHGVVYRVSARRRTPRSSKPLEVDASVSSFEHVKPAVLSKDKILISPMRA